MLPCEVKAISLLYQFPPGSQSFLVLKTKGLLLEQALIFQSTGSNLILLFVWKRRLKPPGLGTWLCGSLVLSPESSPFYPKSLSRG